MQGVFFWGGELPGTISSGQVMGEGVLLGILERRVFRGHHGMGWTPGCGRMDGWMLDLLDEIPGGSCYSYPCDLADFSVGSHRPKGILFV